MNLYLSQYSVMAVPLPHAPHVSLGERREDSLNKNRLRSRNGKSEVAADIFENNGGVAHQLRRHCDEMRKSEFGPTVASVDPLRLLTSYPAPASSAEAVSPLAFFAAGLSLVAADLFVPLVFKV